MPNKKFSHNLCWVLKKAPGIKKYTTTTLVIYFSPNINGISNLASSNKRNENRKKRIFEILSVLRNKLIALSSLSCLEIEENKVAPRAP